MRVLIFLLTPLVVYARRWVGLVENCNLANIHGSTDFKATEMDNGNCLLTFEASDEEAGRLRKGFEILEEDKHMGIEQTPLSWGLDRIDQRSLPLDNRPFSITHHGKGVPIYIIDTGIYAEHSAFKGREVRQKSFVSGESTGDQNGHGTHCSGTALGTAFGVAREASIISVKVLNRFGSGSFSAVAKGVDFAVKDAAGSGVISLSLGGYKSAIVDKAVRQASKRGMIVVIAAGNSRTDACSTSPAGMGGNGRSNGVITVGSTTIEDRFSPFSNYGKCVDILAPGSNINSAWIGSPGATRVLSGTSMSAPHVAGLAASLLEKHSGDKKAVLADLFGGAVERAISSVPARTPNLLLNLLFSEKPSACEKRTRRRGCIRDPSCVWHDGTCYDWPVCR